MLLTKINNQYSSVAIGSIREIYNLKMCYKKHLTFLKYKDNFSKYLSNRIVKRSNYLRSYKDLNYFYVLYLRSNLINNQFTKRFTKRFNTKDASTFLYAYNQYLGLNDLNRALLWKLTQIDSMFKLRTTSLKYKKKNFYVNRIAFIKSKYRILISWTWLKLFIKSFNQRDNIDRLHKSLENFLTSKDDKHVITQIKYDVYRLQLLRSL